MGNDGARSARVGGVATILGLALVAGGVAGSAVAAEAPSGIDAPLLTCAPAGGFPWIDGSTPPQSQIHDTGVNTFVGGDLHTRGSAEAEGRVVVAGDMRVEGKSFIVGIAIGSDVRPNPGELMLQVGGDVTIGPGYSLHIADLAVDGGQAQVGGSVSGTISQGSATLTTGMGAAAALAPYEDMLTSLQGWSTTLAALADNGTVTPNQNWAPTVFRGTGADEVQVFTIDAADLNKAGHMTFENIVPTVPVVVNVVGGPVSFTPGFWEYNDRGSFAMVAEGDGDIAASIVWNFVDATDVQILGSSQVPGSVLAPAAQQTQITASTNGRVYVAGDLMLDGVGNELHAYPWASGACEEGAPGGGAEGDADAGAEGDADAGAEGDADAGAEGDAGSGAEGGADAGAEGDADAGAEGSADAGADGDADAGIEGDAGSGADGDAGAGAEAGETPVAPQPEPSQTPGAASGAETGAPDGSADVALAQTGGSVSPALLTGGLAVLLAGVATMLIARARRTA